MKQIRLNRRNFLQFSGVIATSLVLHQILPVSAKNINPNGYLEGDVIDLMINDDKKSFK